MVMPQEDQRDLMLSMYLDGELDHEQVRMVEEKVRVDESWREEYESLLAAERRVSKVVENNWHDSDFSSKVMARVRTLPKPSTATAEAAQRNATQSQRFEQEARNLKLSREARIRRLGWISAAAALLLFGLSVHWVMGTKPPKSDGTVAVRGEILGTFKVQAFNVEASSPETQMDRPKSHSPSKDQLEKVFAGEVLVARADDAQLNWKDGSVLWLKKGSKISGLKARQMALKQGRLFIKVAADKEPYRVELPDGSVAEALGTRFEVNASLKTGKEENDARIRVVEGRVRCTSKKGKVVLARGGQQVSTEMAVSVMDPRSVALDWSTSNRTEAGQNLDVVAPWTQLGGCPEHSGVTPLFGPRGNGKPSFAAKAFFAFEGSSLEGDETGRTGTANLSASAVVGRGNKVFVVRNTGKNSTQLYSLDLESRDPSWERCGEPLIASPYHAPVITPKGWVVFGTSSGRIRAWNPNPGPHAKTGHTGEAAWENDVDVGSSVWALVVAHDGTILCSTFKGLVVLNESGQQIRNQDLNGDIRAPAAVMADGRQVAMTRFGKGVLFDRDGKQLAKIDWQGQGSILWPIVVQPDGTILMTSADGGLQGRSGKPPLESITIASEGLGTWPLGSGIYASKNFLLYTGHAQRRKELQLKGDVVALAQDGSGAVFAAIGNTVFRIEDPRKNTKGIPLYDTVKKGTVVRGGLAIVPGKLVVTTTEGVQIFE